MIDELKRELDLYNTSWRKLVAGRQDKAFFEALKPVALGWKVADPAQYERWRLELHAHAWFMAETWMNGRWIAKCLLRDPVLLGGVPIVKIMQRRPASKDAVGLDHLDFYSDKPASGIEAVLRVEDGLRWTRESNDSMAGYEWSSIWFDNTEAKIKNYTVLDILQAECKRAGQEIRRLSAKP